MINKWHGVYAVMLTPFTDDEELDEAALRRHVRFLLGAGKVHELIFVQYLKAASEMLGRPLRPPKRPLLLPLEEDRCRLKEALDKALNYSVGH